MKNRFRHTFGARFGNRFVTLCLRLGLPLGNMALLTVPGRKSGLPRTTPVTLGERDGQRWLLSPYGEVDWVRNLRAARGGTLARGRWSLHFTASPLGPGEAAPLLKYSVSTAPGFIQRHFAAAPDAPLAAFERIAPAHPVFLLTPTRAAMGAFKGAGGHQ